MSNNDKVKIFDTTLRDGEQALQASLTSKEKLKIAFALERMGVDIIEAGFPVSSPGDFQSVQTIAREIKNSRIAGLSRAVDADIDAAAEALKVANAFRIHTFIATSTIHVESKLRKGFDDVVEMAVRAVKRARNYTDDVEFSCEDAGRTSIDNLCRMVEQAIKAGATTVNIPDTVGYTVPSEFGGIIETLFNRVPNIDQAIISVHCHDDLGLSVANSIAAVQAGARQIECTVNGIGERAGNCSLEEVVMIMETRKDQLGITTNINAKEIHRTSQLVANLCNMPIQANKAIVGNNAFSHSSGIHQDGVLKSQNTYEIITPETVGLNTNNLNLTSRSGRHVIKHRMQELGYNEEDYNIDNLYESFLRLADKKGQVFDYDLEALTLFSNMAEEDDYYVLESLSVQSGLEETATATVALRCGDELIREAAIGNGPINSICSCISRITGYEIEINDYKVTSTSEGMDALGQVSIMVQYNNRTFHGMGLATDIIRSSARALV
ncbi:MAG: 2-isopropylmalate synthase, partial [Gammaproteobacteria bacterium]|nr:2-isopropylmalate synthase [Gammaproteobacteria bacterium]